MDQKSQYRIRVETCIGTIIDVHKSVSTTIENEVLLVQFQELKKALDHMDMSQVSERDVRMVEQATNALLGEFKTVFDSGQYASVHQEPRH